jgi:signal transduction histidine kinase
MKLERPSMVLLVFKRTERLDLNATQNQFVENSYSASQHLLSIINNILDISKMNQEKCL